MTFKHAKFEDSPVMRSLERLEKQKAPDVSEIFTKVASNQTDLAPTDSLVENILHLCAGLKQFGFDKHAEELETNFIRYKQAQTLYETSSETGGDLVEFAHGKSHKLEDVDSDMAIFYTIVDKQLNAIKMIDKTPTGKLASSRDIINAVKIVLAVEDEASAFAPIIDKLATAYSAAAKLVNQGKTFGWSDKSPKIRALGLNPTSESINQIESMFFGIINTAEPGLGGVTGIDSATFKRVQALLVNVPSLIGQARSLRQKFDKIEEANVLGKTVPTVDVNAPPTEILDKSRTAIDYTKNLPNIKDVMSISQFNRLSSSTSVIIHQLINKINNKSDWDELKKKKAKSWVASHSNAVARLKASVDNAPEDAKSVIAKDNIVELKSIIDKLNSANK